MNSPRHAFLTESEHTFRSFDGTDLFYRAWHPGRPQSRAIVLFHGGHEHSGRFRDLAEKLAIEGVSIFAWDARGHGRSPGRRGDAEDFMDFVRDADAFMHHISKTYGISFQDLVCVGHSVGSVIISTWLHDYAPRIRGAVLGSPAFNVKLYMPFALPALRLRQKWQPDSFVSSYVKPGMLTHDREEAADRRRDELISPQIAVRVLTSLQTASDRVIGHAHTITTPILILSAGRDYVVHRKAQQKFFDNLGSSKKQLVTYDGFYHEIFHETDRDRPIQKAKSFVMKCFAAPIELQTETAQAAKDETFDALKRPLPLLSFKRLQYAATRMSLKTLGRLSRGIRIGWRHGFDSGSMLDYVYADHANGITPFGKLIDRLYLDSVGWKGIRQRGRNLKRALKNSIERQQELKQNIHIMDVAAGPGRYILDTLKDLGDPQVTALCRDRDLNGLNEGRDLAEAWGLHQVTYQAGDAFDPASLKDTPVKPDIVVVSGLYELFSDNALILKSLKGIYDAMADDGILIYTNQPTHPDLELIARTLINRDGDPWIMRLRSQAEMDDLVCQSGFRRDSLLIDDAGIFTVSMARKHHNAA